MILFIPMILYLIFQEIEEDDQLIQAVKKFGKNWTKIGEILKSRSERQCSERWRKINGDGLIRTNTTNFDTKLDKKKLNQLWAINEDILLLQLVERFGKDWDMIKDKIKTKEGMDCKRRYEKLRESDYQEELDDKDLLDINYYWTPEDDAILTYMYKIYEGDWPKVAKRFPDRNLKHCQERWVQINKPTDPFQWTPDQDSKLLRAYLQNGNFIIISKELNKTQQQCEERFKKVMAILNQGLNNAEPSQSNPFQQTQNQNKVVKPPLQQVKQFPQQQQLQQFPQQQQLQKEQQQFPQQQKQQQFNQQQQQYSLQQSSLQQQQMLKSVKNESTIDNERGKKQIISNMSKIVQRIQEQFDKENHLDQLFWLEDILDKELMIQ